MSRPRHPDKHIEKAVAYAKSLGWRWEPSNGHPWGKLFCPEKSRAGCWVSINSTPRVPENHARQIRREIDLCEHCRGETDEQREKGEDDECQL